MFGVFWGIKKKGRKRSQKRIRHRARRLQIRVKNDKNANGGFGHVHIFPILHIVGVNTFFFQEDIHETLLCVYLGEL